MSIDQNFTFGPCSIEAHIGNAPASPGQANGTNALGPADRPIVGPKVVVGTSVNTTVGSSHVVNPA